MARVIISVSLTEEIYKKFKAQSTHIFLRMKALEERPHTGKALAHVAQIVIKELKIKGFRFYFVTDGRILKFGTHEELSHLLIKFVRMSEKKDQQDIINSLKEALRSFGLDGIE